MAGKAKGPPKLLADGTWVNSKGSRICGGKKTRRDCCPSKGEGPCPKCVCRRTDLGPNGRCKFHGGAIPVGPAHHSWKHGRRSSILRALPEHLREAYSASVSDPRLISVEAELGILDARTLELIERLTTGESKDMLKRLENRLDALDEEMGKDDPNLARMGGITAAIRQLVKERRRDYGIWEEIRETTEARRRLSDTERKLLEAEQATVDVRELRAIMAFVLGSVKEHVMDLPGGKAAVLGFSQDVRKLLEGKPSLGPTRPVDA